jgi:tetraacyldisaccharide 4'-kinase
MMRKFPKAYVAVDKKRRNGIDRLTTDEATNNVDVI